MIRPKSAIGLVLVGVLLSSCNRNDSETPSAVDVGEQSARQEDKFGQGFGEAYRADPNSQPANVSASDVKPVSDTAEPEPID